MIRDRDRFDSIVTPRWSQPEFCNSIGRLADVRVRFLLSSRVRFQTERLPGAALSLASCLGSARLGDAAAQRASLDRTPQDLVALGQGPAVGHGQPEPEQEPVAARLVVLVGAARAEKVVGVFRTVGQPALEAQNPPHRERSWDWSMHPISACG